MARKANQPKTKHVPAFQARTQFGQILDRVAQGKERFVVTKNGQAKAVILGIEYFLQTMGSSTSSLAALQTQVQRSGANKLSLEDIEAEIDQVRTLLLDA